MPIPMDTYFTVTPSTNFKAKAHAILGNQELFFYISDTNELRVQVFGGLVAQVLALNVSWVEVIQFSSLIHVYYTNAQGNMFYIPFAHFGSGAPTPQAMGITSLLPFSVMFSAQATPASFIMVTDDGTTHRVYSATDPIFAVQNSNPVAIYTNLLDLTKYVSRPQIAMHPDDTSRITIHVQQLDVQHDTFKTGFYVVKVPGIS